MFAARRMGMIMWFRVESSLRILSDYNNRINYPAILLVTKYWQINMVGRRLIVVVGDEDTERN